MSSRHPKIRFLQWPLQVMSLKALMLAGLLLINGGSFNSNLAQAGVIRDTEIEDALLKIMRPMAEDAGLNPDQMRVRVVIDNNYNAFVAADNMIYMHSGLITEAESIVEVAGVLAHEIGHIASGHIPRRNEIMQSANLNSLLSAFAAIALSASGNPDAAVGVIAGGTDRSRRLILAQSRQDEGVADEWAIKLMEAQNLSLQPMADAMRKIGAQRSLPESRQSDYYLTHPASHERSAVFQDHVNQHEDHEMTTPGWMILAHQRMKTKLEGWTLPPKTVLSTTFGDYSEEATYKRAIAFYRLSDYTAAIDAMTDLTAEHPNDPYYWEFFGDVYRTNGDADAAIDAYEKSIALIGSDLNLGQINLSLGRALMMKGDALSMMKAVKILEKAHQDEPQWAFVKRQLGIAYGKSGQYAAADLILAEEALILGNIDLAVRLAKRVSSHDDASAIQNQLAADIINQNQ